MSTPLTLEQFSVLTKDLEAELRAATETKYDPAIVLAVFGKMYAGLLASIAVQLAHAHQQNVHMIIEDNTDKLTDMTHRFSRKIINENTEPQEITIIHPAGHA